MKDDSDGDDLSVLAAAGASECGPSNWRIPALGRCPSLLDTDRDDPR